MKANGAVANYASRAHREIDERRPLAAGTNPSKRPSMTFRASLKSH